MASFSLFYQKKQTISVSRFHNSFNFSFPLHYELITMTTTPPLSSQFLKKSSSDCISHFWVGSLQWANFFFNIHPFTFSSVQDSVFVDNYSVIDDSHDTLSSCSDNSPSSPCVNEKLVKKNQDQENGGIEAKKMEESPVKKNRKSILIETEFFKSCHIKAEMKNGVLNVIFPKMNNGVK